MAVGLVKLSAGSGYEYLTRQVAALDATGRGRGSLADYYAAKGEAPGQWYGAGLAGLGLEAGDPVTAEQMRLLFGAGLDPVTGARLGQRYSLYANAPTRFELEVGRRSASLLDARGLAPTGSVPHVYRDRLRTGLAREWFTIQFGRAPSGPREVHAFIARSIAKPRTSVAGYDVTFSPVKSVSALWALADPALAGQLRAAHEAAVADALAFIERRVLFTRQGHDGVRQVDTRGLVTGLFVHRDSRAGDPDLHTHVAIANKVQTLDGSWLAIDGRVLFQAKVDASEVYTTSLQARLVGLGLGFVETGRDGRRPVSEVAGLDARLLVRWSSRRAAIERGVADLVRVFEADHERPPTPVERLALGEQATLATRPAKHEPRSEAEQRRVWRAEADALLGPGGVQAMSRAVDSPPLPTVATVDAVWLDRTASQVIARVEAGQASWLEWHVRSEALRQVRTAGVPLGQLDTTVDGIVARALSAAHSVPIATTRVLPDEPDVLRRADGSSLYHVAGTTRFTSKRILDAEARLVDAAGRVGGRVTDGNSVAVALLQSLANGDRLNAGQRLLVQDMATSGRRLQLAIAPAGTGKTTAMRSLALAWVNAGGDVLGLAPSAAAAEQLGRQLTPPATPTPSATPILAASSVSGNGSGADTLAKFVWAIEQGEALAGRVGSGTLVVVDEAGMADTLTLDRVVAFCLERGASVRLVGDDRQLAAVGAGGVLNDIAARHGAVRLEEAVRFASPAEAAASLALRAGDPGALGFYLDHDRVHIADSATATAQVLAAWQRDVASGRDALMLAPTRALVADLNAAARAARLGGHSEGHSGGHSEGHDVLLADGNRASVGDMVLTRQNNRSMTTGATAWVRNGDRWQVTGVRCDGSLDVQNLRSSGQLTLPAWYVTTAVELGYATTIHGAQGVTADVCHGLVTGTESREQLYTLLTRGRDANHVWVQAGHPDAHTAPIARDLVDPSTATQVLERILATADTTTSATTLIAHANDPRLLLGTAVACYQDAIGFASERHLGPDAMTGIEWAGRAYGLSDADAWPTLRSHLALYAANGHDPAQVLADAVSAGPMTAARDEAAVVDHRLDLTDASTRSRGPLPWLPGIPSQLLDTPTWKTYLAARYVLVRDLAADIQTGATSEATGSRAEPYASDLDLPAALVGDLAIWRAAHHVSDNDTRPTGPVRHRPAEARIQHHLDTRIDALDEAGRHWRTAAVHLAPELAGDPGLPQLGRRLAALAADGQDAHRLLLHGLADPLPDDHAADAVSYRIADPALKDLPPLWETVTSPPPRHREPPPTLGAPGPDRSIRW